MIDLDDVQSMIVRPSRASKVTISFVRLRSRDGMRLFLRRAATLVTTATEMTEALAGRSDEADPPPTVSFAVSAAGLDLAGVDPRAGSALSPAFLAGMQAAAHRLGDVGDSDPTTWDAPFDVDPEIKAAVPVHAAVIVHGTLTGEVDACLRQTIGFEREAGEVSAGDENIWNGARLDGYEPFGFRDNISDPVIEGSGKPVTPGNGVWDDEAGSWRAVRAGEALLGYVDESGALAGHPDAAHIERNGSYLVLRKLEQEVDGFWRECAAWAEDLWPGAAVEPRQHAAGDSGSIAELGNRSVTDDPTWDLATRMRETLAGEVAAQLVGRRWDGTVLGRALGPPTNDFLYRDHSRAMGITVPPSAHIRRTNPRDGIGAAKDLVRRHLLFRRGFPYYQPQHMTTVWGHPVEVPASRGLLFMACCADLRRQFEFVQSHWLQDGSRFGVGRERDPLTGRRPRLLAPDASPSDPLYPDVPGGQDMGSDDGDEPESMVSIDDQGSRCRRPLSGFVRTRGGEYFLLPSRSALLLLGDPNRAV